MYEMSTLKINCVLFTKRFISVYDCCSRHFLIHTALLFSLIITNLNNKNNTNNDNGNREIPLMQAIMLVSFFLIDFFLLLLLFDECALHVCVRSMRCQRQGCLKYLSYIFIVCYCYLYIIFSYV